jgi:isoaspartyl peptidase/L-asparaginase-like protein (Ntn-hydrolase superfamily)
MYLAAAASAGGLFWEAPGRLASVFLVTVFIEN